MQNFNKTLKAFPNKESQRNKYQMHKNNPESHLNKNIKTHKG